MSASRDAIEQVFRESYSVVLASIARIARDIDLAEEAVQDALVQALRDWPKKGIPDNPPGWISTVARRRAIDRIRRRENLAQKHQVLAGYQRSETDRSEPELQFEDGLQDDRLELMFACCHPSLYPDKQIALTLRTVGGLTTGEIARAFLVSEATMAQRLVRAKSKIRDAGIPFRIPNPDDLTERLASVLAVIYLIFNEGYFSSSGDQMVRRDLIVKAIELGGVLAALLPDEPEVQGLLALMLFHASRHEARVDDQGNVVLLKDQDRGLWNGLMIERGRRALRRGRLGAAPGPYLLQAEIALEHIKGTPDPDWSRIVSFYDQLVEIHPAPVVLLNRAVAVGEADGCQAGLAAMEPIASSLHGYHAFHAARGHFLAECGSLVEADKAYRSAIQLVESGPERRFLELKLRSLSDPSV